jgi:hypothetical protein
MENGFITSLQILSVFDKFPNHIIQLILLSFSSHKSNDGKGKAKAIPVTGQGGP